VEMAELCTTDHDHIMTFVD